MDALCLPCGGDGGRCGHDVCRRRVCRSDPYLLPHVRRPAFNEEVTGTYEEATDGLFGGIDSGSRVGTISKDIGGLPVNLPIPGLAIPSMIYGGLSGATKRQIQDFRDELTKQLAQAGNEPLTNNGLAQDVYSEIRTLPALDSKMIAITTPIPEDTDAVLFVGFQGIGIDVQGKEAIITTSATATLRRVSDARDLYQSIVAYTDRDTLSNWTANDNALWRDYANFARHYLGRELSADLFDRIELEHELLPVETESADQNRKNNTLFVSKSLRPTLAWELELADSAAYRAIADEIDESNIYYDVEIYDAQQLVYYAEQIQGPRHALEIELEPCQTYRWSVRPSYHVRDDIKFGEWMRFEEEEVTSSGKGIIGRQASEAPAYVQDFASLEIKCGRR
jgi:hypothetical protein